MKQPSKPKKKKATSTSLVDMASWVARDSLLFTDEASPFTAAITPGDPKLVVIVGENVSGKSLFFRILTQHARSAGLLPVTVSIRERTGGGSAEMGRMRQMMMYGQEDEQSTGATSVKVTETAFRNLDRPGGSMLGLDEPEMGLSDGYAAAFGQLIGTQTRNIPAVCSGVVVVTHSRALVRGLLEGFGATPTFVRAGAQTADLDTWLDEVEVRSVDDLLALPELGLTRWRTVLKLVKD